MGLVPVFFDLDIGSFFPHYHPGARGGSAGYRAAWIGEFDTTR
jgi:hypothetical protein